MRRRIIEAVEGQPITHLSPTNLADLNRARTRLTERLRPTFSLFEDTRQGVVPRNIVGTVGLNSHTAMSIMPKVGTGNDWVGACLDLMVPERASLAGHRRAARTSAHRSLESGLAVIYRDRLERALRAEGPIEAMHSESVRSGALDGQLDIEQWVLSRARRDITFPVHRSVLDADNELTSALSLAAVILSRSTDDGSVRAALIKLSRDLRPGLPDVVAFDPSVIGMPLPQQWSRYGEAWSIAQVVLTTAGFTSRHGSLSGIEVALEPWVLLEELLERTVNEVVRQALRVGLTWHNTRHPLIEFLHPDHSGQGALTRLLSPRFGKPENLIKDLTGAVVSFEAKYSRPKGPAEIRQHMYQLLTTSAHAGASIGVLVYPELAEPIHWRSANALTSVRDVYAVGIDLFGYSKEQGVAERATSLLSLIKPSMATNPPTHLAQG